ncbi:hypothetical protein GTP44_26370 [Duganella sp. FT50W]|uniref:Lipoprotein n=1 Tax=Duganella lactea TaxID=2692173 RepID=A0A6L8MTX4_9BURK|nr:hypothetical protein [Duganella lactea]MYM85444.1 hypothetical protein [Duganella lactea]
MIKFVHLVAVVCAVSAVGCATRSPDGVRHGYVSKVYSAGEKPVDLPACLSALTSQQLADGRFVDLKYGTMRLRKYATVYAPNSLQITKHDKVEFTPIICEGNDFPRILRVVKD